MNQRRPLSPQNHARVKKLGYAKSKRMRIYGEEFEVVSDPFSEDNLIGIKVAGRRNFEVRVVHLPVTLVLALREEETLTKAA
jgi:hypothetical protein